MKEEARILVSACRGTWCFSYIVRGRGVDGAAAGTGCKPLCERISYLGFMGELRYHYGACSCGLPEAPLIGGHLDYYFKVAGVVASALQSLESIFGGVKAF